MKWLGIIYKIITAVAIDLGIIYLVLNHYNAFGFTNEMTFSSELEAPPVPTNNISTNPPPPRMSMDVYYSLPEYIKTEVEQEVRDRIDAENRPRVQLLWKLSLTDEWKVIGEWRPYQLQGFYKTRVVIEP